MTRINKNSRLLLEAAILSLRQHFADTFLHIIQLSLILDNQGFLRILLHHPLIPLPGSFASAI